MKKFTRTGKKVLSLFLSVLMVMTTWVFVAPEKAEAAAGKYYIEVLWSAKNSNNFNNNYKGYGEYNDDSAGMSIRYRANNGTADGDPQVINFDLKNNSSDSSITGGTMNQSGNHTLKCTLDGFPVEVYAMLDDNYLNPFGSNTVLQIKKISIGSSSQTLVTVWEGDAQVASKVNAFAVSICLDKKDNKRDWFNSSDDTFINETKRDWTAPAPDNLTWSPTNLSAMTCPKTGTAKQTVSVVAKDRYGVQMYDPMWSVSGSSCGTTGISMSTGNNRAESSVIQLTNSANIAGTTDSQTGTVTATWGTNQTKSKTFTINDTTYTATFAGLKNNDGTNKTNATANYKHGHTPTAAATAQNYAIGDYDYTFSKWSPTIGQITADTTYTAQYTSKFVAADLTELNTQISNANYVKTTELWTTGSYTQETMNALESALTAANNMKNSNPGRTQQTAVNSTANALKQAIDALKLKTYKVYFYDSENRIIDTQEVVAGNGATAPSNPAKDDDETYHYSFKAWDKTFNNVTSDLHVKPTYTSEAHKWQTSTTVEANCQHGKGVKKVCSVCSRVSESYDDALAPHESSSPVYAVTKEATCTEAGAGYYYCTVCGTNMGSKTIPAKGHAYDKGTVTKSATCTATGIRVHKCTTCGDTYNETLEKIPHTYAKTSSVAANCQHSAYDVMTCSVCGDTYNKYTGGIGNHTWKWDVKSASLTANGTVKGTCTVCGYTTEVVSVPFDGHHYDFDNPSITNPTCTKAGSVVIDCTDSGCTEKITIALSKTGVHNYTTRYNQPSCNSAGSIVNTCSVCGTSTTVATVAALGHNYGEAKVTAATCTAAGSMKYTCARCGDVKSTAIPATGHKEYTVDAIEATCNTAGRTAGKKCAVCGETILASTVIAKKGHSFTGETKTVAATCEADGAKLTKCANCDAWKIETISKTGHNYKTEVVAPSCTSKGYTKHTCQNCGKVYTDSETAMSEHNYVLNTELSLAPSCEGKGVNIYVCSVCGSSKSEQVAAKGHSFGSWSEYVPATCANKGVSIRTCSDCGKVEMRDIPAKGHAWETEQTVDVEATCISAGQKSTHCSRCNEVKDVTAIPALGHSLSTTTTSATCTTSGKKIEKCSRCDYEKTTIISEALGHNFVPGTPVAATCKSSGYTPYTCSRNCGVQGYNVINGDAASAAHNWNITSTVSHGKTVVTGSCSVCGATFSKEVASAHDFKTIESQTPATCTKAGSLVLACAESGCSEKLTVALAVNPNAHGTVENTYSKSSCTAAGTVTSKCGDCDKTLASTNIPATGHSFTVQTEYVASTCKTQGHITFKCANCTQTKTVTLDVNPDAHKFGSSVHHNATCTTPAYDKYTCENGCGESYEKITGTVAAHAWTFSTSQTGTTLTITCKCSKCDAQHTQTVEVAEGHNYSSVTVTKQPTCSAEGTMTIACDKKHNPGCTSTVSVALPVNPNAHQVKTVVTPATCTTAGTAYSYCELCRNTVGETVTIAELGHNYVGGVEKVVTAATCENDGVKTVKCTRCDDTIEIAIPKTGHAWDAGTAHAADCTHGAYTTYKCANCSETKDVVSKTAEALGHDWGEWTVTKQSTNTEPGLLTRTCSRDSSHKETAEIPAGNHEFDSIRFTETPATCTAKGSRTYTCINHENCGVSITVETDLAQHSYELKYDSKATCTTDGKVTMECSVCHSKKEITIPAFGHTWDNGEVTVEPTHKTAGERTFTCSTCGEKRTETIEKLPHNFVAGEEVLPTCKDGGKSGYIPYTCECGESYNEITDKKIEHKWGAFETVQAASADRCGIEKRTCTECGAVDYKITDATGDHTYVDETVKEATCTEEGSFVRRCTNPNHTDEEAQTLPIPALGHAMVLKDSVDASCEHEGYSEYECSRENCSFTYRIVTAVATGHTEGAWEVVRQATCTTDGLEQQECTTCGKILAQKDVPATGHTIVTVNDEATCTTPGQSYKYCSVCKTITSDGITVTPAPGHDWGEWTVTRKSTNTEPGLLTRTCNRDSSHTETVETPAGGHTFDMNNPAQEEKATCSKEGSKLFKCTAHTGEESCGIELTVKTEKIQHEFETTTVPASCTESGVVTIACKNCDEAFDEIRLTALGHDFSEVIENVSSTCNSVGHVTKKCSRCDETEITYSSKLASHNWGEWSTVQEKTDVLPKIEVRQCSVCGVYDYKYEAPTGEHEYDGGVITTKPTCTAEGVKTFTCVGTHCSCTDENRATYTVSVAPTGHSAKVENKEATCTEAGYVKAVCEKCNAVLDEKTLEKKAHVEKVTITEPTCTTPGQRVYTCAVCGETTKAAEEIPVVPHAYVATGEYVDATCTSPKYEKYRCTYCGDEKLVKVGEAAGHDTTENYVTVDAPTCTKAGYSEWRCHCGALLGTKVIQPANHTWVKVTENLPKECDGAKVEYEKCSVCGAVKADSVEITEGGDHVYNVETKTAATCTTGGMLVITCKHCENIHVEVEIPAVGHSYGEGVLTEGTCEKDGFVTFTCTREGCTDAQTGHTLKKYIGKKNHNYVESGDPVAATCTSSGYQLYKCEYCDKEFKEILEAPVSHEYEKQPQSVEPKCYVDGHYIYNCKNCDAAYEYDVAATGRHEIKSEVIQQQTCTEPEKTKHTCATEDCPYEDVEITKVPAGHAWGNWKVTKEPNEATGENGEQVRKCNNCDETQTAPIPASIHNWIELPEYATEANCTEAATRTYYCHGCDLCTDEDVLNNASYVETVGTALNHNVSVDYKAATCTENGSYKATCVNCGKVFEEETLPALGHSFNNFKEYTPATCQEEGSVTYVCSNKDCEETQIKALPVNPNAHKMVQDSVKPATCTEAGYTVYKCANQGCTHTYMMQIENPKKHTPSDTWTTVRAATCHGEGYEVLECKDCHAVMETRTIAATAKHSWITVKSENENPTCTESSYSYNKCSVCGKLDESSVDFKNATGHDFSVLVESKDATATEDGYVVYKCSHDGCDAIHKSVVPKAGHSFESAVTKEPTCTEKGVRTFTCTAHTECDANYTEEIPALGHLTGDIEITPATCLAAGRAVVKCTRDGCDEIIKEEKLEKLAHSFNGDNKTVKASTCLENGSITYTCTTEGCDATLVVTLDKLQHTYAKTKHVDATCRESGYDVYTCTTDGCTASYNVITDSANGHTFVEDVERTVKPGCATVGHKYFKCSACGADGYDYEVPATGKHNFRETVRVEAKCESAGYTYNKCTECDAVDKSTVKAIDPLGHDYSVDMGDGVMKCSRCESTIATEKTVTDEDGTVHAFVGRITKQSTCKEAGTIEYICHNHKNCEKNHIEALELAAHSATAESIEKTEPKCKNDGSLENGSIVVKCSVCGEQIGETVIIPAAHKYSVVKVEKATCASKGKVTERCSECGHEKITELEMDASGHDFEDVPSIKVDATCTADGYEVYECKHCGVQKFVKTGEKLNHVKKNTLTVEPTCENDGYIRTVCADCGLVVREVVLSATGHKEETVRVEPTCRKAGSETVRCSVCGEILSFKILERTEHKWGDWVVISGGTCATEGQRRRTCSVCGETETISTGVGEHIYSKEGVVTKPTCTTDGYTTYACEVCGYEIVKDYTPKLGHKYSADYRIYIEPTCHSTGAKAHYCVNCGSFEQDVEHKFVEIPRLAHAYGEWKVTVEPTCETTGIKVRTCTNAGCPENFDGHTETAVLGRLGHNYGDWSVVKEATCVEKGIKQRVCDRCHGVESAETAMVRHKIVADPEVPATCEKTGLTAGSHCSVCGRVFVEQEEIPLIKHMDLGGDGRCDTCGKTMTGVDGVDTCLCHGTGFRALVYRIVRIIWKLFKVNQYCVCGEQHW